MSLVFGGPFDYFIVVRMTPCRSVSTAQGMELASRWGCPYVETSVRENNHVDDVFLRLLREVEKDSGLLRLMGEEKKKTQSTCAIL